MKQSILIVDDEEVSRFVLWEALSKRGYSVSQAGDAETGLKQIKQQAFDLILLDIELPGISGIDAISKFKEIDPSVVVLMIAAHSSNEMSIDAIKRGAYDFFIKPYKMEEMEIVVKRSLERRQLERDLRTLREQVSETFRIQNIIGKSGPIQEVLHLISRVADTTATTLIWGETGTGKELIARAIHQNSPRADKPMVKLNCEGIPEGLLESELFGFEKGAFTGATERKIGKFELADKGTIFLDEIGDMNLQAQAKILRILQEMEFERLGGTKPISIDVRVIAATNRDLRLTVQEGGARRSIPQAESVFREFARAEGTDRGHPDPRGTFPRTCQPQLWTVGPIHFLGRHESAYRVPLAGKRAGVKEHGRTVGSHRRRRRTGFKVLAPSYQQAGRRQRPTDSHRRYPGPE